MDKNKVFIENLNTMIKMADLKKLCYAKTFLDISMTLFAQQHKVGNFKLGEIYDVVTKSKATILINPLDNIGLFIMFNKSIQFLYEQDHKISDEEAIEILNVLKNSLKINKVDDNHNIYNLDREKVLKNPFYYFDSVNGCFQIEHIAVIAYEHFKKEILNKSLPLKYTLSSSAKDLLSEMKNDKDYYYNDKKTFVYSIEFIYNCLKNSEMFQVLCKYQCLQNNDH